MSITSKMFESVSKINRNSVSSLNKVLKEENEFVEDEIKTEWEYPYDNTTEKFCPRCGKTYTEFPAWSRYDDTTMICPDCAMEEAMVNYTGGRVSDPHNFDKPEVQNEEVTIENPSAEDLAKDEEENKQLTKDEIEQKIGELRAYIEDGASEDEIADLENQIADLEYKLNESTKVLTEAPDDEEEFELVDEPTEEAPLEEPIDDENTEEMSDEEVQDEAKEDEEDTIEDDVEQPFYATTEEFDELRDLLVDLDYRLFLINDNMVCIGRLNGPDIEFLTSNRPENTDTEPSEQNDKAEEIENKAEEDGEQSFEYKWIKAPDTFDKFVNQVNVVYLSPEMSDEDKEQYAGIEASHDSIMDFLMNELPEDKKEEHEEEEIEEEIPEEIPMEEPVEDEFSDEEFDEPSYEELPEDEEEE